jgi:N-hydroxyarylamine O-acetyltransferase
MEALWLCNVNARFRARIGLNDDGRPLTFDQLGSVLERIALAIPFENLAIIESRYAPISKEQLANKVLDRGEGGLCYELNSLLYYFLLENGMDAKLVSGVVYNHERQQFPATGRTHVTILVRHESRTYLVDTGFGSNLPLRPVPLTGETVSSWNGEFRIVRTKSELGNYRFEMKLKHKHDDWMLGYVFDTERIIPDDTELNAIQRIIAEHPDTPFNKARLTTRVTERGTVTLTQESLTEWLDGVMTKTVVDNDSKYRELLKDYFGLG